MTFARLLFWCAASSIAAITTVKSAERWWSCSKMTMWKLTSEVLNLYEVGIPSRLQCVTTSRAGKTFPTTRVGSHPTFVSRMKLVKCIISSFCAANLMAGTAGIAAEKIFECRAFPKETTLGSTMTTLTLQLTSARHVVQQALQTYIMWLWSQCGRHKCKVVKPGQLVLSKTRLT